MIAVRNIPKLMGGAAVLGALAIGLTAPIANAEWDIEAYDNCMRATIRSPEMCCVGSGGVTVGSDGGCRAPAAEAAHTSEPGQSWTVGTFSPPAPGLVPGHVSNGTLAP